MPYKGKAPLTIGTIQPCCPGLIIDSITKEEPIFEGGSSPGHRPDCPSDVTVASFCVMDARGNTLKLISKRSKQSTLKTLWPVEKENDIAERMNEVNFYLHYSDFFHGGGVSIPKAWSIKAPQPGGRGAAVFTLLLSDLCSVSGTSASVRGRPSLKLDYYDTVAAIMYLADFHSIHWESRDNEAGSIFELGGGIGRVDAIERDDDGTGTWGDLSDKLATMKAGLTRRVEEGMHRSRKHRTIIHGNFVSSNLMLYPSSNPEAYSTCASFDFKKAGRGYGVYDLAVLLCESVDQGLLVRDQREEEFVSLYFQHLCASLRARKKPPLPPGYNITDAKKMYEVCLLLYCAEFASRGKGDGGKEAGYEYAVWRCRELVGEIEKQGGKGGKDITENA
eukprot:CAMPEP_0118632410 /NCGR_PEP_ID=MMETSP0785-20121206/431_1 /TAXON_ID=91992 /ORGANISM="Bolidomonas pacifica, Strain CCMP 1866" /LENGTH=390 /DNA_ID=CAMNT_0006523181 /DNA_START=14 /DNA_END=1182 /DNA_ORIENTATION=+